MGDDITKKWKCTPGEKQASVVLQLEKSTNISSIDIGNDGSAFVEVLVGRSSHESIKYQVLLVASSFMSPQESRVGTSPNQVRIFSHDKLSPDAAAEKWDIVKIVCTQPFNKRASYGLSFVRLHSLSEKTDDSQQEESSKEKTTRQFGGFKLKKDDSDSKGSSFHPGQQMLMAKKGEVPNVSTKKETTRRSRSPDSLKLEEKRRKIEPKESKPTDSKIAKPTTAPVNFNQLKKKNANSSKVTKSSVPATQPVKREAASSKDITTTKRKHKVAKPFDQILNGVHFVLSGFQNPLRSDIREKALRMGAQYRKDWTPDSTHLVCAFPNTPKFHQVLGVRGRIVRKDWIDDCERMRRPVSWRNYSMNSDVSSSSSSEEEAEEDTEEYKPTIESQQQGSDDPYEESTDEGGDTEDEIEKLQPKVNVKTVSSDKDENAYDASTDNDDPYDVSTDDEDDVNKNENDEHGLPSLPDYFERKHFLLYGDFGQSVHRLLTRHIIACGGKISKYMDDDIEYVISEQKWDEKFDSALSSNTALVFVKPSWVFSCGAQQKLLSTQPYLISHS